MRRYRSALSWMTAASLTAALASYAAPATALAAPDSVAGYDYVYAGEVDESGAVEVLTVAGKSGETVYINIQQGDKTIASHLAFTLTDETGEVDANGDIVGVVSVVPVANISLEGAQISVFADRAETQPLYTGTISYVFARLGAGEGAKIVPLGVRTLAEGENRAFVAPATLEDGGVIYELSSTTPVEEASGAYYAYEQAGDTAESMDGHVTYYDVANPEAPLYTETIEGIELGSSQTVEVPAIVSAGDDLFRTLQLSGSVTLSYPGATEHAVMCTKLSSSWGKAGSFYTAKINYVAEDGTTLSVGDSVIVNKKYLYTPPTRLHLRNASGEVVSYKLSTANDMLSEDGALVLQPGDAEGSQTYNVVYEKLSDTEERAWTVVIENGAADPNDRSKREIGRITYHGVPGESVTHETAPTIDVDGVEYVPTAAAQETYEHTFAVAEMQTEQTIYYVPAGYVEPDAYDITVNYVNIATNEVISSESYTAAPTMRSDLEIVTPEGFTKDGVEYVRLNGQELPIRHSFYATGRVYTVYYRDINDDLHAKTVITTVRVEYVDAATGNTVTRPTTVTDNGTTTTDTGTTSTTTPGTTTDGGTTVTDGGTTTTGGETTGGTTTDGGTTDGGTADGGATTTEGGEPAATGEGTGETAATADDAEAPAAVATGIATGSDLRAITDGTYSTIITDDGTPLSTVRIEDDENPLASGLEGKADTTDAASAISNTVAVIASSLAAAAGLIVFFFIKRRKRSDEDSSSNDNANA